MSIIFHSVQCACVSRQDGQDKIKVKHVTQKAQQNLSYRVFT